jgi:endoglucanase
MNESQRIDRRSFLLATAGTVAAFARNAGAADSDVSPAHLPRWRGFNLLEKFIAEHSGPFSENDFVWMAEWGFDFVRLPLSYHCWSNPQDPKQLREPILKEIDQAVTYGRQHHVHVCLNFHRAPGYCVNPPAEPRDLWTDEQALEACAYHWGHFAERYKGIPSKEVSFNLLNEPGNVREAAYVKVVRRLTETIHERDPDRLVIADGLQWGRTPVVGLVDARVAQSTRGYDPVEISHFRASWMRGSDRWPTPTWPLRNQRGQQWDRERLRRERIVPWKALEAKGVGVHVGEWGAFNRTPHAAVLAWMRDSLALWKEAGWGWALWNLRGGFGVLDSDRRDVAYEDFHGHKLDRQMLEVLREG